MKIFKNLFILFFLSCFCFVGFYQKNMSAYALDNNDYEYNFSYNNKVYKFNIKDFNIELSDLQKRYLHNSETIVTLKNMNFSNEEILKYLFPEVEYIYKKLSSIYGLSEELDEVYVIKNKCELKFKEGNVGKYIDKQDFYNEILKQIEDNKKIIDYELKIKNYKDSVSIKDIMKEKGCFTTNFETSSPSRKNNIRVALKSFDGVVLNEGEILSFNETTGKRNEENGYQKAKIISNGTFIEDFGGGVCQVSTTLYNACLLAGLEIIESNSHSLPVSYIEPSFDAMVSGGHSDLKIRNNSGGKIIITTSYEKDRCKIKIFGKKNKFKITRHSEKVGVVKAEDDIIETDYLKYGLNELKVGEFKRLSYSKDGFISRGYLNYYDEKGNFIKTTKIRENKYNATKGIIIKREN